MTSFRTMFFALSAFGLSANIIVAWTGPSTVPPSGNVAVPINIDSSEQSKTGIIDVYGLLINGSSQYLNFGNTTGSIGYGIRNNGGILEFKNNGGTWAALGGGGGSQWTTSDSDIYYNTGNVGIGTSAPNVNATGVGLHVHSTGTDAGANSASALHLTNSTTGSAAANGLLLARWPDGNAYLWNYETSPLLFGTASSERMRIASSGEVGIGSTLPSSILDINGALTVRGIATPAVSPAGQGRIYFDTTANKFKASQNGGAYTDLVGGGVALSGRTLATQCAYFWSAYATGWRTRTWLSGDCTSGLPQAGDLAMGWGENGNGTVGQVNCTATTGQHYNHPGVAGATSATVTCNYYRADSGGSGGTSQWANGSSGAIYYSGGNVGIGTTEPFGGKLDVAGSVIASGGGMLRWTSTGTGGATACWVADTYGVATVLRCTSLRAHKENITPLDLGLETVLKLAPKSYQFKPSVSSDTAPQIGFIAEEVDAIDPRLTYRGGDGQLQTVRYDKITALLTHAIQQLKAQADEQQAELASLRRKIQTMNRSGVDMRNN